MTTALEDCPNDSRGWHVWSARYPSCCRCGGDLRHVCICGSAPYCPVHRPHPQEDARPDARDTISD